MSKHYYGIPWRVRGQDCGDIRLAENIHDHTMSVHPRSVIYLPLNAPASMRTLTIMKYVAPF